MAAIEIQEIEFDEVIKGDAIDITLGIETDLDMAGKTFYAEVIENPAAGYSPAPVLRFLESNGSLERTNLQETEDGLQAYELRFLKTASETETIPAAEYRVSLVIGTMPDYEDKQTIGRGLFNVVTESTKQNPE